MAAQGKQTGPRTPEGIAAATKNLEGHPTPEEARRTRFNGLKHGLFARTARYFPARPGRYPHCNNCDIDWGHCATQPACIKRTELFLKHHIAFETGDPTMLMQLRADLQANVQAIIDDMVLAIIGEGVQLKTPAWYYDKEGCFHLAEYREGERGRPGDEDYTEGERRLIYEINAHPLLKILSDFIAKNALSLADMNMTPRAQEQEETLRGTLDAQRQTQDDMLTFQQRQTAALEAMTAAIERSRQKLARDPVLIEHGEIDGD